MSTLLRDERLRRDLSASDVALRLSVHPTSVLRWERRERLPGPVHLSALARTLALDTAVIAEFFDEARPASDGPGPGARGHGLRPLRRAASVDVRTLARRLGVPPSTVYNWEAGRARVPQEQLDRLAGLLGLDEPGLTTLLACSPVAPRPEPVTALRRLRRRTGLSQEQVARRIGTTRHRVGAWERGQRPPLWAVRRLAHAYGVPVAGVARAAGLTAPPLLDARRWRPGDLPAVLRTLRQWSGLSQRGLAERCGCHPSSVRAWEGGRALPSAGSRERLERVYGLRPGSLLAACPPVSRRAVPSSSGSAGAAR